MSAKLFVIAMLILIVASLFSALVFLFRGRGADARTARALTVRISLSLFLFLVLMAGYYFKLIPSHGL